MAHDQHDDAASASFVTTTDVPKRKSRIRSMIFPLITEIGVVAALTVATVYFVSGSHVEPDNASAAAQTPQPVKSVRLDHQSNAQSARAQSGGVQSAQSGAQQDEALEAEASDEAETYTPWVETDNDGGYYQPDTGYYGSHAPPVESAPVDAYVPQPEPEPQPEPVPSEEPVDPVNSGDNGAEAQQSE